MPTPRRRQRSTTRADFQAESQVSLPLLDLIAAAELVAPAESLDSSSAQSATLQVHLKAQAQPQSPVQPQAQAPINPHPQAHEQAPAQVQVHSQLQAKAYARAKKRSQAQIHSTYAESQVSQLAQKPVPVSAQALTQAQAQVTLLNNSQAQAASLMQAQLQKHDASKVLQISELKDNTTQAFTQTLTSNPNQGTVSTPNQIQAQFQPQAQFQAHSQPQFQSQTETLTQVEAVVEAQGSSQVQSPVEAPLSSLSAAQIQSTAQAQIQAKASSLAQSQVKAISQYESANSAEHMVEDGVKSKVKGEADVVKAANEAEENKLAKAESDEDKGQGGDSFSVKVSTAEILKVVEKLLGPQGEMGIWQPDFKFREGQLSLAKQVARSLNSDSFKVQLLEAGTGIGKTYAYLIPLLILRKRALISTATNFLQNQLALHDIPQLLKGLGLQDTVSFTQIMGVHHYFCHVKLDQVLSPELALKNFQLYCNRRIREAQEANNIAQQDYWRKRLANGQQEIEQYRSSMVQGLRHALDFEQLSDEQVELKLQGLLEILKSVRQALLEQDDELLSTKRPDHLPAWFGEIELSALRIAQSKGLTPQQIALYDKYVDAMQRFLSCESLNCPYCPLNNGDSSYKCWYRLSYKCAYFSDVVVINHALLLFEVVPSSQISNLVFQQQNLQKQRLSEENEVDEQAQFKECPEQLFCKPVLEPNHEQVLAPTKASGQSIALESGQAQVLSSSSDSASTSASLQAQSKIQEHAHDKSNEHSTESLRDKSMHAARDEASGEVNADKGESNAKVKDKTQDNAKSKLESKPERFTEYLCNQINQGNFGKVTEAVSQISYTPSHVALDEAKMVDTCVVLNNDPTKVKGQASANLDETSKIQTESSSGIGEGETASEICVGTGAMVSVGNGLNHSVESGPGVGTASLVDGAVSSSTVANSANAEGGSKVGKQVVWQLQTSQERDYKSERLGFEVKRKRIHVTFGENLQENFELGLLLMQRQALVIDEAHDLENTMRHSFSTEFTSEKLLELLKELKTQGLLDSNLGALISAFGSLQHEQCRDKPDGIALNKLFSTHPQLLQEIRNTRDQLRNVARIILFNKHKSYELWRLRLRVQKLIDFLHCMYNLQHNFTRMAGSFMLYADHATFNLDASFSFKANIPAPALALGQGRNEQGGRPVSGTVSGAVTGPVNGSSSEALAHQDKFNIPLLMQTGVTQTDVAAVKRRRGRPRKVVAGMTWGNRLGANVGKNNMSGDYASLAQAGVNAHVAAGAHELYRFKLKLTPLNLADYGRMLFTVLQECNCVPILTSATLRVAEKLSMSNQRRNMSRRYTTKDGVDVIVSDFNTLKRHIGLEPVHSDRLRINGALSEAFLSYVPVEQMVVGSPFDFAHRSLVWCSGHFAAANDEHGPDIDARRRNLKDILPVINSNPGATLILVSSFQLVDTYKQLIQERHPDWQLFCQNRHENLESTVQRFKAYQASKHINSCACDFNLLQNSCAPDSLDDSAAPTEHPETVKSDAIAELAASTAHSEAAESGGFASSGAKLGEAEVKAAEVSETDRVDKPAILIGTDSCWTGLNLKGAGLHLVVIDKLPFTPIGCLEQQHSDQLRSFTYFNYERLPKALARLKQGMGRLIRAERDWGVVILATPFQTKRYAPLVYKTLEPMPWVETTDPQIVLQFMRKFSTTS